MTDSTRQGRQDDIRIEQPGSALDSPALHKLAEELEHCPDVAFAYLNTVVVASPQGEAAPTLFVWLRRESMGSIRSALNLVSEAVSRALPDDRFLDVAILNSAPELLGDVERSGTLVVLNDTEERLHAQEAMRSTPTDDPLGDSRSPWWWPF